MNKGILVAWVTGDTDGWILHAAGAFKEELAMTGPSLEDHFVVKCEQRGLLVLDGEVYVDEPPDPDIELRGKWRRLTHEEMQAMMHGADPFVPSHGPASYKPSDVDPFARSYLPFMGTFERAENELGIALLVCACQKQGDEWQPVALEHLRELLDDAKKNGGPWQEMQRNPFAPVPDFVAMDEAGYVKRVKCEDGEDRMQLTELTFQRIEEKGWVVRYRGQP